MDKQAIKTVTIYKRTCIKGYSIYNQGTGYSLYPWENDPMGYSGGYDDGGREYVLPEGYELGEAVSSERMIFDSKGDGCDLLPSGNGCVLVGPLGIIPIKLYK